MTMSNKLPREPGMKLAVKLHSELSPIAEELTELALDASKLKIGFIGSFTRKKLDSVQNRYSKLMKRFLVAYRKWMGHRTDELMEEVKPKNDDEKHAYIAGYIQLRESGTTPKYFGDCFVLIDHINKVIGDHKSVANNCVAISLSLLAITVSVILFMIEMQPSTILCESFSS